jgi:hypothetical protein
MHAAMGDQDAVLTREQLFEFVWSKPISQLEQSHGFAVVLSRSCAPVKRSRLPRGATGHRFTLANPDGV